MMTDEDRVREVADKLLGIDRLHFSYCSNTHFAPAEKCPLCKDWYLSGSMTMEELLAVFDKALTPVKKRTALVAA